jgi:hypothetical protein
MPRIGRPVITSDATGVAEVGVVVVKELAVLRDS